MSSTSDTCGVCDNRFTFQVKRKKEDKFSFDSKLKREDYTIRNVLEMEGIPITPNNKTFVCSTCKNKISNIHKYQSSKKDFTDQISTHSYVGKKVLGSPCTPHNVNAKRHKFSTPVKKIGQTKSVSNNRNCKKRAIYCIQASKYTSLFRLLIKCSKSARNQFNKEVRRVVTQEVNQLTSPKQNSIWREGCKNGIETIGTFTWDKVFTESEAVCPCLTSALSGAFTSTRGQGQIPLKVSTVIGQVVFARKPRTMKTLQQLLGIQLWLSGTSTQVCGTMCKIICNMFFFLKEYHIMLMFLATIAVYNTIITSVYPNTVLL